LPLEAENRAAIVLPMTSPDAGKRAAARAAAELVTNGMRLGLGSGSTFLMVLELLGERVR
jgi:ribose 5-phosphate isomerase